MKGFFVTGTDTDVGKTWFMLKLGELLIEKKINFHFLKPVESGCEEPNNKPIPKDAIQFSKLQGIPLEKICKYMFKAYASPPKAAKIENKNIELEDIVNFINENKYEDDKYYNIVEGCGGFFSPIANNKLSSDLAVELNLPVILVVKNKLGCINHTLLTIQAIKKLNLKIKFIVLNNLTEDIPLDNYDELSDHTNIPIIKLSYNKKLDTSLINYIN